MDLRRIDTQRAYELIWDKITTLELAPGAMIDEGRLSEELGIGSAPLREAISLLAHEGLVVVTPRHGLFVLGFLPSAVEQRVELVQAIKARDADRAEQFMRDHVEDFYQKVGQVLERDALER